MAQKQSKEISQYEKIVILNACTVLDVHENEFEKDGEKKVFRTVFVFKKGDQTGRNKSEMIEMSADYDAFMRAIDLIGKPVPIAADLMTFNVKGGGKQLKYSFVGSASDYLQSMGVL
jgi:hypothetical protein